MKNPHKKRRWQSKPPIHKKYIINLPDGFQIVSEYDWQPGRITHFVLILIRKKESDLGYHEVCRYDTAHGFAHLDLLNNQGRVVEKIAITGKFSYKTAYPYAKNDLQKNYKVYWQAYINASPKERP